MLTEQQRKDRDESNERWERRQRLREELRKTIDRVHDETMRDRVVELASGRKITIDCHAYGVLIAFKELEPLDRIRLLEISIEDAADYIKGEKERKTRKALEYLTANLYWRYTGDPYDLDDEEINEELFGMGLKRTKLLAKVKRGNVPMEILDRIIYAVDCDNPDLYIKEDLRHGLQASFDFER